LLLYLLACWLGFGIGELAGDLLGLDILMIGQIHVVEGTIGAWLLLLVVRWLRV